MTKSTCVSSAESPTNYSMSDEGGSFDLVDLDAGFDQHAAKMTTSNNQTPQKSADPAQAAASV